MTTSSLSDRESLGLALFMAFTAGFPDVAITNSKVKRVRIQDFVLYLSFTKIKDIKTDGI